MRPGHGDNDDPEGRNALPPGSCRERGAVLDGMTDLRFGTSCVRLEWPRSAGPTALDISSAHITHDVEISPSGPERAPRPRSQPHPASTTEAKKASVEESGSGMVPPP